MSQVPEDSDDDVEAGYISSDESAHPTDLAERLRIKPSRDIWELGKSSSYSFKCRTIPFIA